jgi:hypothetical protein
MSTSGSTSIGCGLSGVIAAVLSYALNQSFWWAVLHFFLSWLYILYVVFTRSKEIVPALKSMF